MPTLPFARIHAGVIGAFAATGLAVLCTTTVVAQVADADILADSELALVEEAGSGAYQHFTVTLRTHEGQAVLTTNKDGTVARFTISAEDSVALWRAALESGLEALSTTPAADAVPDASEFTVKYRVQGRAGAFTATGVDTLPDGRYRAVVRAILALATRYARSGG
jgi:hypothetical protein